MTNQGMIAEDRVDFRFQEETGRADEESEISL